MSLSDVDYIRIICWAHTYRYISDQLKTLKIKKHKNKLLSDMSSMQLLPTEDIFVKAVSLFYIKWGDKREDIKSSFVSIQNLNFNFITFFNQTLVFLHKNCDSVKQKMLHILRLFLFSIV